MDVLFERLHDPDPVPALKNVSSGWKTKIVTHTCMTHESLEPQRVHVLESSGQPALDESVVAAIQGWRIRTRPGWKFERPVCLLNVFDIRVR